MLATTGGFVCICPKKEVELGADKLLHRATHDKELHEEIEFAHSKATTSTYAFSCGGALRAINPNSSMTMAQNDTCAAVFKGNLSNKAELGLQVVGCPPQLNEAQLLLHLYAAMGLDMLGRLQGQYAFCLYDSKQARVLAARDHSGAVPLVEGRTAAGSLIIACGTFLPEGVHQMVDIEPGEYKYGWHALPRQFKCGAKIVSGRASCEYGIRRRSTDAFNASPRVQSRSLDIPNRGQHNHHHHHGSSSATGGSQTPGRYVPPHSAGAGGGSFYSRSRASSLDSGGHWGPPPGSHVSASLPIPHGSHFAGRRKSENTSNSHNGVSSSTQQKPHHQQQQHHVAKPAPSSQVVSPAAGRPVQAPAAAAAAKAAAAALAAAAAATAATSNGTSSQQGESLHVSIPAPAAANPGSPGSEDSTTPLSRGTSGDLTSPHRRKRRHRSRKHKANSTASGSVDASSDTESQVSTLTQNSGHSLPTANGANGSTPTSKPSKGAAAAATSPGAGGGQQHKAGGQAAATPSSCRRSESGRKSETGGSNTHKAGGAAQAAHHSQHSHHKQQQQWQPKAQHPAQQQANGRRRSSTSGGGGGGGNSGGGFKRNGSCGELAALGSSPTPHPASAVQLHKVAQEGLAC